jgi:acyl-CoA reductase-like NAD-dependent aldehyde dehydrogenase
VTRSQGHDLDLTAIDVILRRREELVAVLCEAATHRAAVDELRRSLRALAGAAAELARWRPARQHRLAVFMPSNNILYSYVLFGLIPMLYCDRVVMRPSRRVSAVTAAVHRIIASDPAMPDPPPIVLSPASQRQFLAELRATDVVIFTGRPENAAQVAARNADGTLLTFGSGTNPVVVGPDADLDVALPDLMAARLYNSGQDCLCPDVILVHGDVLADFVRRLCDAAARLVIGPRAAPDTDVAPLTYHDVAPAVRAFLSARSDIVLGGRVDVERRLVEPTVVVRPWTEDPPPEFFAPVFNIVRYDDPDDVRRWLCSPSQLNRGMYLSVYGEPALTDPVIGTSVTLPGRTTFDAEDGNRPFGGYGPEAGAVHRDGLRVGRPLLLSAELGRGRLVPAPELPHA